MSKIKCLSPHVADMIAAGEVVERPGSAVKELIENAVDAGAGVVTVEIQNGGMSYIRVTDDGCGMSAEDAETAFIRHATSKLHDEYGLEAIRTLGFRGEALAAISAVSTVEMMTREKDSDEGTSISLEAGVIREKMPVGCPVGTTIIVRSLFYNTPARLKFMKKDSAEAANVGNVVIRCAMSHPEVSIRYIKDGKEEFRTPGDGNIEGCIYSLLGRDFARALLKVDCDGENGHVGGFVTTPANARGNRGAQFFFVNGRFVKSALLQSALEQAYKNSMFTGRFPGCVLYLDIKYNEVDVNVHPAKTEVKFLKERKVFDMVYLGVKAALTGENTPPEIKISAKPEHAMLEKAKIEREITPAASPILPGCEPVVHHGSFERSDDGKVIFRQKGADYNSTGPKHTVITRHIPIQEPIAPPHETIKARADGVADGENRKKDIAKPQEPEKKAAAVADEKVEKAEASEQLIPEYRIIGEAFREYIIVECDREVIFIDKHAAHERILFDKLKSKKYETMSQLLLEPIIVEPGREEKEMLLDNKAMLNELGFEIEDFGGASLALRQLPADVDIGEANALLDEICRDIKYGTRAGNLGVKDEILATVACKAAIKAGWITDAEEWKPVVEAVLSGKVKYCPHGRPVTIKLTKSQLDKNFRRT